MRNRPSDPCLKRCCWSPYGICGSKRSCQHHIDAQWAIEMWELEQADKDYLRYSSEATKARAR